MSWKENTGTTPHSMTIECDVEYPDAAAALIDLAVGLDEQTFMGLHQKQATVKKLTAGGAFEDLSNTCSKIDGKWAFKEPMDRYGGGSYPLEECPVIPRKVMAVFAKEDGTELYNRVGTTDSFEVQRFDSKNHCQDVGHGHYFAHEMYRETDYASSDDEEDNKYLLQQRPDDVESPSKKPRMTDDFPWTNWMLLHGPLVVIYRHPIAVGTFNLDRIVENRRSLCKCDMCTFWNRADANEVWKASRIEGSIPIRNDHNVDIGECDCYHCETACESWIDRSEYDISHISEYNASEYGHWCRNIAGMGWDSADDDLAMDELDISESFDDYLREEFTEPIAHDLRYLKRPNDRRMFAAVEVALDDVKLTLSKERLPKEMYTLCQMIRVAEAWSAISVQEELLNELSNRVSDTNTIHLGKALTTVYKSVFADGFADGLLETKRHGAIVLKRAMTKAMDRYAKAAGVEHLVNDLHGIVAHEADACSVYMS